MRNTVKVDFKTGATIDDGSTGLGRLLDRVLPGNLGERWDNLTAKQRRGLVAASAAVIALVGINVPFDNVVGSAPEHLSDPVPANVFAGTLAQEQLDAALKSSEGKIGAQVLAALNNHHNMDKVLTGIGNADGKILTDPNAITAGNAYMMPGVEVVNHNNIVGMVTGQPGGTRIEVDPLHPTE